MARSRLFRCFSAWRKKPLQTAIGISFVLQLPLIVTARYRLSYDAYVHIFFADHYRHDWWSLWEPRWYAGFPVNSSPPLAHQLVALLSFPFGVEAAFAIVLLAVLVALPVGVFAFARVFVPPDAAGYAAVMAAALPSVYLAAHAFGQLPTLMGLLFALLGFASLAEYLRNGRILDGALTAALVAVTAAAHHGTLLLLPWGAAAVALHLALNRRVGLRPLIVRLAIFGLSAGAAALIVIWPFWQWGLGETMQTPIDHLSRHNFLLDPRAALMFFWPVYGPLALLIPWAVWQVRKRELLALEVLFVGLFILGLGGTTPLPRWLYGSGWAWLTYDRFALWASVALLPLAGIVLTTKDTKGHEGQKLATRKEKRDFVLFVRNFASLVFQKNLSLSITLGLMSITAAVASLLPTILPTQPKALDLQPVASFLTASRAEWRYLTFGFGDQMARLSLLTTATTIDGSYHTARTIPELRVSGIGQIDSAYWNPLGVEALGAIIERSSSYGVRWAFVNHPAYAPLLARHGWTALATLSNGVEVWENPRAMNPPLDADPARPSLLASVSWGLLPLLSLAAAGLLTWKGRDG